MMTEPMMVDTMPTEQAMPMTTIAQKYKIKRVGARPLHFTGSELGMAMSFAPTNPYWYEVNIYRTPESTFVLAIRLFFASEDEQDVAHAWECETFGEVMDILEGYDAAQDVRVKVHATDPALTLPELAANAMALRAEAASARQQYRGLVGEILHDLENG